MARKKIPDFETALEELENLVSRMESGDMKLDDALTSFEAGIKLSRDCQQALENAEQKVQLLLEKEGGLESQAFDSTRLDNATSSNLSDPDEMP